VPLLQPMPLQQQCSPHLPLTAGASPLWTPETGHFLELTPLLLLASCKAVYTVSRACPQRAAAGHCHCQLVKRSWQIRWDLPGVTRTRSPSDAAAASSFCFRYSNSCSAAATAGSSPQPPSTATSPASPQCAVGDARPRVPPGHGVNEPGLLGKHLSTRSLPAGAAITAPPDRDHGVLCRSAHARSAGATPARAAGCSAGRQSGFWTAHHMHC